MFRMHTKMISAALLIACGVALRGQQPPAASKANFERLCGSCHEPERSTSSRRTRDQWLQTVNQMVARGAEGSDDELMAVVDYLAREHGRVNVNLASAAEMAMVLGLTSEEAAAIVQYRRDHGGFEDASGVAKVPGVDATKLAARRDAMVFGSKVAPAAGRVPVAALTAANNWPSVGGGPQRENWARPEAMLSRDTVGAIKLVYTRKLDNQNRGSSALTAPLILGNLISYRGFKEMLIVGGSADNVYSIDAVLNRVIWSTHLPSTAAPSPNNGASPACAGGLVGIVMNGTAAGGLGGGGAIRRATPPTPGAAVPAQPAIRNDLVVGLASGFGRNGLLLAVASDGNVHPLYQSNGASFGPPLKFLPAKSLANGLNLNDNVLYAATVEGCGGPNAVYAIDLSGDRHNVEKFETNGSGATGSAGTAIGNDGTVYAQVADGRGDTAGQYRDTVIALTPKDLKFKDYFTPPAMTNSRESAATGGVTPAVFRWNGNDVVLAGSRDGRLFLLDSSALGGADHHTPLAQTPPIGPVRGAFATWEDPDTGSRWIYAPLSQPPAPGAAFPVTNGPISNGAVAAFKVEDRNGRPTLTLQWVSRDMMAPATVVANGLLFALSSVETAPRATLYVLDALTGKQLFTSGDAITGRPGSGGRGLAVANGRVYFTTEDNTVYSFGIPTEH
jgi:competence ComEA-like helix-hairpin-helix protein